MSMLSSVEPWDLVADGYAEITMKVFQGYAEEAIKKVGLKAQDRVLDVACGPGTVSLTVAPTVNSVHSVDFSEKMIAILNSSISDKGVGNIETFCCDGQNLPFDDNTFDTAFSMFGLMFFPDRVKGFKEIYRSLKLGGKVVASSWAPITQSPAMMAVFGALRAMNPDIPEPQTDIKSLENPDLFKSEMEQAGFKNVEVFVVTKGMAIEAREQYWDDMIKGSAPIAMMKRSLSDEQWQEKNKIALEFLSKHIPKVPAELTADAWFGYGEK